MDSDAHDAKVNALREAFNLACTSLAEANQAISDAERVAACIRKEMGASRNAYHFALMEREAYLEQAEGNG